MGVHELAALVDSWLGGLKVLVWFLIIGGTLSELISRVKFIDYYEMVHAKW